MYRCPICGEKKPMLGHIVKHFMDAHLVEGVCPCCKARVARVASHCMHVLLTNPDPCHALAYLAYRSSHGKNTMVGRIARRYVERLRIDSGG